MARRLKKFPKQFPFKCYFRKKNPPNQTASLSPARELSPRSGSAGEKMPTAFASAKRLVVRSRSLMFHNSAQKSRLKLICRRIFRRRSCPKIISSGWRELQKCCCSPRTKRGHKVAGKQKKIFRLFLE